MKPISWKAGQSDGKNSAPMISFELHVHPCDLASSGFQLSTSHGGILKTLSFSHYFHRYLQLAISSTCHGCSQLNFTRTSQGIHQKYFHTVCSASKLLRSNFFKRFPMQCVKFPYNHTGHHISQKSGSHFGLYDNIR